MMNLDYRFAAVLCLPWVLTGCPDPIAVETTDDTGDESTTGTTSSSTPADSTTTTGTKDPTTTGVSATDDGSTTASAESDSTDTGIAETGPPPTVCGNNVLEGEEVCDLAQLSGETCQSLGFQGGQLGCLLTCDDYNLLGCFICGNEVVDIAEDCEGTVHEDVTCVSLGFEAGDVTCGNDCLYDLSECSICGDGIQQGPEDCDGIDFGGESCMSLGFDAGNIGCNLADCAFSYVGCSGGQYIQNFEGGMVMPLEFDLDVTSPWFVDDAMPINGTYSARSGAYAVGVGGITNLTLDTSFPAAGDISFFHETSCANGVDFLEFYVDGIFQQSWTGITAAAELSQPVAAGMHTFQWRFSREGFLDEGANAVWVDDITLSGGVPI